MAEMKVAIQVRFPWWTGPLVGVARLAKRVGIPVDGAWVVRTIINHQKIVTK